MSSVDPTLDLTFQRLRDVRLGLLRLHKALLDSEKQGYESVHGRIRSTGEFFQLVIGDEWFSWLRPMSQFIAQVDEAICGKEPLTVSQANDLLSQASELLEPSDTGAPSQKRYLDAIQRDPTIALMHAELSRKLAKPGR